MNLVEMLSEYESNFDGGETEVMGAPTGIEISGLSFDSRDVQNGNMFELQPDDACDGGSDNIMGLVSGANIYIANTQDNGRGNQGNLGDDVINAGLIALNDPGKKTVMELKVL